MIKYCLDLGIYIFFLGPLNIMSLITRFQNQLCITNTPMVYLHSVLFFPIHGVLVAQSRPTLCDPMDHSLPSSFVHWILQARMLEWVAIPFSRGSSQPRDLTWVSRIGGRYFTIWATRLVLPIYSQVVFWEYRKSGETYQAYFFTVILGYCSLSFISSVMLTLCDAINCSTPGFPVLHNLTEWANSFSLSGWCHPTILIYFK